MAVSSYDVELVNRIYELLETTPPAPLWRDLEAFADRWVGQHRDEYEAAMRFRLALIQADNDRLKAEIAEEEDRYDATVIRLAERGELPEGYDPDTELARLRERFDGIVAREEGDTGA